ncbi:MAG: DNA polymerase III subunit beta [Candidatus Caldatribacteriaceae bacterium]
MEKVDIQVETGTLREAVGKVYRVVSGHPAIPVLSGILLEAGNGTLTLTATDYEMGVRSSCPVEMTEEGSAVLPGKIFSNLVRSAPKGLIRLLSHPDHTVEVFSGKSYYKLSGFPPEDFPLFPPFSETSSLTIPGEELREALLQTYFAVSKDEMRPPLTGVFFSLTEGALHLVSTDGHRLSVRGITRFTSTIPEFRGIVPARSASELLRLVSQKEVVLFPGKGEILFQVGETELFSRLIEGEYPRYEQVIPREFVTEIELPRVEFLSALERASLIASVNSVVEVHLREEGVELLCQAPEVGIAREELEGKVEGQRFAVAFNVRYLLEALRVVDWEKVKIGLSGELSPAKVFQEGGAFQYVIMPVKLREE